MRYTTGGFSGLGLMLFAAIVFSTVTAAPAAARDPKISVKAYAGVTAITPGVPFEVALKIDIEDGWHIYWKNSGDSGLPPEAKWDLPPGFTASPLEHPAPERHRDGVGLTTFIHEGQPILTASLTPPPNLSPNSRVDIKGEMIYLACKTICVRGSRSFKLSLPVHSPGSQIELANKKIFDEARSAFPQPPSKAKYVSIEPVLSVDKVRPRDHFKLALVLDVQRGYHVQSHRPLDKNLIATDVFAESPEDILLSGPDFPDHEVRKTSGGLEVAEYSGRVLVHFEGEADNTISGDTLRFAGIVRYQACDMKGLCLAPQNIAWELPVEVARPGDPVRQVNSQYFGAVEAGPVSQGDQAAASGGGAETGRLAGGQEAAQTATGKPDDWLEAFLGKFGIAGLLVGCFVYGLLLNATPCVLPLLSIKVLGFVQQAHESRRRTLMLGLAFGAGVVIFFVALGFVAAAGKNVLQYPAMVIGLSAVVMALALSMLGVYTLQAPSAASKLEASIKREGLWSSFGKGALAPVLGFACTGPLLAGAFSWATQQPPQTAVVAFVCAGLGMAAPYVLLGANPKWLGFIPKPGQWMITFERIMGFLLLAMVVWLLHPVVAHMGVEGLEWTLVFFVVIAMACWLIGKIDMSMTAGLRWRYRTAAALLVAVSGILIYGRTLGEASVEVPWQEWSPQRVTEALDGGSTVLVDFTAAYCTVCKVNKKVAFNTPQVIDKIRSMGIVALQGDFTTGDPDIAKVLREHDRAGVPLDLLYPAGMPDQPIVLRPNLTREYLLEKLEEAGTSAAGLASRTLGGQ